jgi:hypothetical protein
MLASELARVINELSIGEYISYTTGSPDMWQSRGMKDVTGGQSVGEVLMLGGIPVMPADTSRVLGWQRVHENLATDKATNKPGLLICESCRNLIRTLPLLSYDEHNLEDAYAKCEDHAPEALRYGLMSRPSKNPDAIPKKERSIYKADPFKDPRRMRSTANGFLYLG